MNYDDLDGLLVIRLFSTQHDNARRGKPIIAYRFRCCYRDAAAVRDAWLAFSRTARSGGQSRPVWRLLWRRILS